VRSSPVAERAGPSLNRCAQARRSIGLRCHKRYGPRADSASYSVYSAVAQQW